MCCAPRPVRRAKPLRHDALATEFAGVCEQDVAIALEELVQDNSRMWAARSHTQFSRLASLLAAHTAKPPAHGSKLAALPRRPIDVRRRKNPHRQGCRTGAGNDAKRLRSDQTGVRPPALACSMVSVTDVTGCSRNLRGLGDEIPCPHKSRKTPWKASCRASCSASDIERRPRLILEIDVSQILSGALDRDKAGVQFFDRPRRREAAVGQFSGPKCPSSKFLRQRAVQIREAPARLFNEVRRLAAGVASGVV